jgi:hypothetical protein
MGNMLLDYTEKAKNELSIIANGEAKTHLADLVSLTMLK